MASSPQHVMGCKVWRSRKDGSLAGFPMFSSASTRLVQVPKRWPHIVTMIQWTAPWTLDQQRSCCRVGSFCELVGVSGQLETTPGRWLHAPSSLIVNHDARNSEASSLAPASAGRRPRIPLSSWRRPLFPVAETSGANRKAACSPTRHSLQRSAVGIGQPSADVSPTSQPRCSTGA